MAIRIKARSGESAEAMMRRFKKLCEKEGLTKDIKKRAYYEKPSERKQRAMRKSTKRYQVGGPITGGNANSNSNSNSNARSAPAPRGSR